MTHKFKKRIIEMKVLHELTALIDIVKFFLNKYFILFIISSPFGDEFAQFIVKVYIRIDERK
ncbi:hypothetical protein D3C87_07620 [compost metagenome]